MTSHPSPQPPEPAPRRRRRWPWIAGMLAVVIGAFLAWNFFTLRRAEAQLEAAGFSVISSESLMDRILNEPGMLLRPGAWGSPKGWPSEKWISPLNIGPEFSLRNLDTVASALRRIQPDGITLSGCSSLEHLDGLNGLDRLRFLFLGSCSAMQDLNGLNSLTSLEELHLNGCSSLRNVDGIKGLTGMKFLELIDANGIHAAALRELRNALPNTEIFFPDGSKAPPQ